MNPLARFKRLLSFQFSPAYFVEVMHRLPRRVVFQKMGDRFVRALQRRRENEIELVLRVVPVQLQRLLLAGCVERRVQAFALDDVGEVVIRFAVANDVKGFQGDDKSLDFQQRFEL